MATSDVSARRPRADVWIARRSRCCCSCSPISRCRRGTAGPSGSPSTSRAAIWKRYAAQSPRSARAWSSSATPSCGATGVAPAGLAGRAARARAERHARHEPRLRSADADQRPTSCCGYLLARGPRPRAVLSSSTRPRSTRPLPAYDSSTRRSPSSPFRRSSNRSTAASSTALRCSRRRRPIGSTYSSPNTGCCTDRGSTFTRRCRGRRPCDRAPSPRRAAAAACAAIARRSVRRGRTISRRSTPPTSRTRTPSTCSGCWPPVTSRRSSWLPPVNHTLCTA